MGCVSSKILTRSASFREELQKHLQGRRTDSHEDIIISKTASFRDESTNQPSITKKEESKSILLAKKAEEDKEVEVQREEQFSKKSDMRKEKIKEKELLNVKVPKFEFLRTESLRDWLSQGSYITPKFGNFEHKDANECGEESEKIVFDPKLVAQLEEAMEEMIVEEDEILRQIV